MFQTDQAAVRQATSAAHEETKVASGGLSASSQYIVDYLTERDYPLPRLDDKSLSEEF
jgi:hypothetical protein